MDDAFFISAIDAGRNILVISGDPRPLHRDLDLHLVSSGVTQDPATLDLLRDGLTALALWILARPRFDAHGWTIGIADPRLNLFFTGSGRDRTVVGRAFHEHLAEQEQSVFHAQTRWPGGETRTSSVDLEGAPDLFGMVEQYARKSDGVPARYLRLEGGRAALAWPFPDADRRWLEGAAADDLVREEGRWKVLARTPVAFRCGCDLDRITRIVFDLYAGEAEEFFGGEPTVEAECPRCGTIHEIERESFERLR